MNDFDFLTGHFDVAHRQLTKPLTGSDEWIEYGGATTGRTHFGGAISIDEMQFPDHGYRGLSVRLYNPTEQLWSIYWVDSRDGRITQPPVRGSWSDGIAELTGEREYDGRPVLARYRWSDVTEQTAHWELAYSIDDGATWETNWTMDFTRRADEPPAVQLPKVTGDFDFLVGDWNVHNRRLKSILADADDWFDAPAVTTGTTYFNGAVSTDEIDFTGRGFTGFTLRLFDPVEKKWSIYWVMSTRGVLEPPVQGGFDDEGVGSFHGPDEHEGRPVDVRFRWTAGEVPVWKQFFSGDGGRTWEHNWTMTFTRPETRS